MSEINVKKYDGGDVWWIQEDFEYIMEDLIQHKSKVQRFQSLYVAARERGRFLQKKLVIFTSKFRVVEAYE